jgi:hypothetical protein
MQYRIKNLHDGARRMLKAKNFSYKQYDKDNTRNDLIMERLFDDTKAGKIKGFYLVSDTQFKAYTRSTKEPGKVQYSSGYYENGELIPCFDIQMSIPLDLFYEGYSSGIYQIIA